MPSQKIQINAQVNQDYIITHTFALKNNTSCNKSNETIHKMYGSREIIILSHLLQYPKHKNDKLLFGHQMQPAEL